MLKDSGFVATPKGEPASALKAPPAASKEYSEMLAAPWLATNAKASVGSIAIESGPDPELHGEPETVLKEPLAGLMPYTATLLALKLATSKNLPLGSTVN